MCAAKASSRGAPRTRAAEPPAPQPKGPHIFAFSEDGEHFLLDGAPFQIRSGEMHPVRIPVEYWQANYDAISAATTAGLTVVEAAGNGQMNLDDDRYHNRFDKDSRDSGAITDPASPGA